MPRARITELKLALADFIDAAWTSVFPGRGADDEVVTASRVDYALDPDRYAEEINGRKVCIFEIGKSATPADRGEDAKDYEFMIWVMEHYKPAGDPTEDWLDDRKHFVEWLESTIGNARVVRLLATEFGTGAWPQEGGIENLYDLEKLANKKLFMSAIRMVYREHAAP